MKRPVNGFLAKLGYRVAQYSPLLFHGEALNDLYKHAPWIKLWLELTDALRAIISSLLYFSKAQLGQDLFACIQSRTNSDPRPPYFVDIGASDSVRFSNT